MRRCEHSTALRALPLVSPCLSRQAGLHDFRKPVQGLAHALDLFFNRRFLCDDLFHHRVTGQKSASAQPLYPSETTCSQCAARRETHTADNTRNDEQAHNYQEEQCIHRAVSFLSRVGCRCLMRSAVNSRLTPTPCLPAQGICQHHILYMLWRHGHATVLNTFLTVARDHLPVPARPAHIAATSVVVAIGMAIRKSAPESHEHRRCEDRRDQRYTIQVRLTSHVPVQDSHHQQNDDKADNHGPHDAQKCTPPGQQFANKSYQRRNQQPDDQISKSNHHRSRPPSEETVRYPTGFFHRKLSHLIHVHV